MLDQVSHEGRPQSVAVLGGCWSPSDFPTWKFLVRFCKSVDSSGQNW